MAYLFVNKVKQNNTPKLPKIVNYDIKDSITNRLKKCFTHIKSHVSFSEYLENKPELKVFNNRVLRDQVNFEDSPKSKFYGNGNKIVKGTFQVDQKEEKVAVSHHDLVAVNI